MLVKTVNTIHEGAANSELDKDTDGSNFNSKVKSKLSSSVKYLVPVIDFYWIEAIANVGLLFAGVVQYVLDE